MRERTWWARLVAILAFAISGVAVAQQSDKQVDAQKRVLQLFSASPAVFIENTGQIEDSSVRYVFKGNGANIYHTTNGPVFQLFKREKSATKESHKEGFLTPRGRGDEPGDFNTVSYTLSANFVGAKLVEPKGAQGQKTKVNYYTGNDPSKWRTNVATYAEVVYPGVYEGIDLHTFGKRSHLKYEFHVAAGADYSQIVIRYEGIEGLSIDNEGRLHIGTPMGELIDDAPVIWQEIDGRRVEIESRYRLIDKTSYTFEIAGQIDADAELIIDPDLAWASFLGGSAFERGSGVAVDSAGNALIAGFTCSTDFPTPGGFDTSFNGYYVDAFVAKVTNSGQLAWASYLGGSGHDRGSGVAVDPWGNVFLTGDTNSTDFPVPGGFDTSYNGGDYDAFVAKVTNSGQLAWASYLGGSRYDEGYGAAVDSSGNVFLTGDTNSTDFPVPGGFDTSNNGSFDVFVAKMTSSGDLSWASYLGGSDGDCGRGVAVSSSGNVFLTGTTGSTDFPCPGGFDTSHNGYIDVFVAKMTSSGGLSWASFLGGSDWDEGFGIAVDSSGNALITGFTYSYDFPTPGGFDTVYNGGCDAFVAKVTNSGGLAWASFLGGSNEDHGFGIAVDSGGNAVITGDTYSTDFPTPGGFDTSHNGYIDVFVAKIRLCLLIQPNGGETWVAGTKPRIEWVPGDTNEIPFVRIELSLNNGQIWSDVNTDAANTGYLEWLVPRVSSNRCLIRVSDAANPDVNDTSDAVFTITECPVHLPGDLNWDCYVDLHDFQIFASGWLQCGNPDDPRCAEP